MTLRQGAQRQESNWLVRIEHFLGIANRFNPVSFFSSLIDNEHNRSKTYAAPPNSGVGHSATGAHTGIDLANPSTIARCRALCKDGTTPGHALSLMSGTVTEGGSAPPGLSKRVSVATDVPTP